MAAWLHLFLLLASPQTPPQPVHRVDLRVVGSIAMAEVWRTVDATLRANGNRQAENTVDLNLPEQAALLDWEIVEHGERAHLVEQSEGRVSAGLAAVLKMRGLHPSTASLEEGTDFRIHVTPLAEPTQAVLHYRYVTPVGCSDGKLVLRVPDSLEENPMPAEVTVTIERRPDGAVLTQASLAGKPAEIGPGARRLVMRGLTPARNGWEVSWAYGKTPGGFPGQALVTAATLAKKGRGRQTPRVGAVAAVCLGVPSGKAESGGDLEKSARPPGSVILLVDRSRSVGPGGLSDERAVGRALLEALPQSVPFNAILFGETVTQLFPLPRLPTREALEAFTSAVDPNQLERKTDVAAALARAAAANREISANSGAGSWIVLITDGALPPDQTAEKLRHVLSGTAAESTRVIVLLVRQRGDDAVTDAALAELSRFVGNFGGLVRDVPTGSAAETVRTVISAVAKGGDWFDVRLGERALADELPVGQGRAVSFVEEGRLAPKVVFFARGIAPGHGGRPGNVELALAPASTKAEWLEPLVPGDKASRRAWAGATSSVAVAVLPASPVPKKAADDVVHGRIDETVLRNALALAFMPRARACYLSRRVATANDAYLRGRLRLQLNIERGELHDATIRQSTLDHPEIEDCVRNAAWAVEYPRPEHRDAPTVANLNLVFRPRTAEEKHPDASSLDREIELVLGPLTFTADFKDLLEHPPALTPAKP